MAHAPKPCRFRYQYDFGDSWDHEIVFEGFVSTVPGVRYPRCVAGAHACPPEDVGGVWGYADFLDAIKDPKHEDHEDLLQWIGGAFDPGKFDPTKATKDMRRGLPNWRQYL